MDPAEHIAIVRGLLTRYPRLTLDLSRRVLEDQYFGKPGSAGCTPTSSTPFPPAPSPDAEAPRICERG
ncbi:hypothetical protein [Streptomyces nogalater]|uniref:Uncharacterized protein n=1 Tax=Streptomyces nogalater TaxID=38314 RepID=A0ABW0WIZ2_STRNO